MSRATPCFLKNPAFCPSSENEFSQVPARPAAIRRESCAGAVEFKPAARSNADSPRASIGLDIFASSARPYPSPCDVGHARLRRSILLETSHAAPIRNASTFNPTPCAQRPGSSSVAADQSRPHNAIGGHRVKLAHLARDLRAGHGRDQEPQPVGFIEETG